MLLALRAGRRHGELRDVGPPASAANARVGTKRILPERRLQLGAVADRRDQRAAERLVAERVADDADLRVLPRLGDGQRAERLRSDLVVVVLPGERHRQEIALRLAVGRFDAGHRAPASASRPCFHST